MFRETTNDDFNLARQTLEASLKDLFERKKMAQANKWITKFLETFEEHARILKDQDKKERSFCKTSYSQLLVGYSNISRN
jgi:hypothetical protein